MTDDQTLDERVHAAIGRALSEISERLAALEARVEEIQARHEQHGDEPEATQLPA